jgi:hydrogenase-4 component F
MVLYLSLIVPLLAALVALTPQVERRAGCAAVVGAIAATGGLLPLAWKAFVGPAVVIGASWRIDRLSALLILMIQIVAIGTTVASLRYVTRERETGVLSANKVRRYYLLLPPFIGAMLVTVTTDHLGVLWIALETTTLATTPLVALYEKDGAIEAAWKYLLLCSVGISVSLLGLLLLATAGVGAGLAVKDALSLSALRSHAHALDTETVKWAFVFLFIGLGAKVGFVPMHTWLPDAHSRTPSPISAALSGVLLNVALYAILRTRALVDLALGQSTWTSGFFLAFGLGSVLFAAFVLLHQQNYKRLLAYSSVEHMGLIAFGLAMGPVGAAGAVMHMLGHTLAKSSLFFSAGEILLQTHTTKIASIRGLWRKAPLTSLGFLLGLLALFGAPCSIVFASELTFVMAAAQQSPGAAIAVIVALAIVMVGVLRQVLAMMFEPEATSGNRIESPGTRPTGPERPTLIHAVVAAELVLLFAGGIFFLTAHGYDMAAAVAATFTLPPGGAAHP